MPSLGTNLFISFSYRKTTQICILKSWYFTQKSVCEVANGGHTTQCIPCCYYKSIHTTQCIPCCSYKVLHTTWTNQEKEEITHSLLQVRVRNRVENCIFESLLWWSSQWSRGDVAQTPFTQMCVILCLC